MGDVRIHLTDEFVLLGEHATPDHSILTLILLDERVNFRNNGVRCLLHVDREDHRTIFVRRKQVLQESEFAILTIIRCVRAGREMHLYACLFDRRQVSVIGICDALPNIVFSAHTLKVGVMRNYNLSILAQVAIKLHQVHTKRVGVLERAEGVLSALSGAPSVRGQNRTRLVRTCVEK